MPDEPFYVDVRKWPDAPHWHCQVFELGEDAHGRWFCLPGGSVIQRRPDAPRIHPSTTAKLIPAHGSWAASFNTRDQGLEVYVDVAAGPARAHDRSIGFIDLDLDIVRDWQGHTSIIDTDEFEEHRVTLGYPESLVAHARTVAEELHTAVATRREPFGEHGADWLRRALTRTWPIDPQWLAAHE